MDPALGGWEPLALPELSAVFASASFRWWVTGGHALELFAGRSWRAHADTDVSVCRADMPLLHPLLADWSLSVAAAGVLSRWSGTALSADRDENNVWCRRAESAPWCLDITVSDGDAEAWVFRRDPRLRVPWSAAVVPAADGTPYLAPALQLLFKSRDRRPKDDRDAKVVIPLLDQPAAELLCAWLPTDHGWRALIG